MKRVDESFPDVPPEYSSEFKELVGLCLIRDPKKRPSAEDLLKMKCMKKQEKINKDSMKNLFKVI